MQNSVKSDLIQLGVTVDELMRYKPKRTVETTVQKREIQKRKETFDWASSVADKPIIDEIYHDGPSNFPKIRHISHPDMIASDTHSEKCTTDDRHPSKADDSVVIWILQSPEPNVPSTSHSNVPKIGISNKCDTLNSGTFQNIDTQGNTVHSNTQDFVFSLDSDQFTTVTMDKEIVTFLEDQFTDDPKKDQFPGTLDVGNIITSVSQEPTVPKDVMSGKSCRGTLKYNKYSSLIVCFLQVLVIKIQKCLPVQSIFPRKKGIKEEDLGWVLFHRICKIKIATTVMYVQEIIPHSMT